MSIRAHLFDQKAVGIGGRIDLRYLIGLDLTDQGLILEQSSTVVPVYI